MAINFKNPSAKRTPCLFFILSSLLFILLAAANTKRESKKILYRCCAYARLFVIVLCLLPVKYYVYYRKIVEYTAAYGEQMPYGVKVAYFLFYIEYHTEKVKPAAYTQIHKRTCRDGFGHGLPHKKYRKPHNYIADK